MHNKITNHNIQYSSVTPNITMNMIISLFHCNCVQVRDKSLQLNILKSKNSPKEPYNSKLLVHCKN